MEVLDELDALLTRMADNPASFGDAEGVQALHRPLARLEAVTTVATAAFDASGEWEVEGAGSAAAWMAVRCTMPKNHAWRRVHLGRALRHLPVAEGAWLEGRIGAPHVAVLAGVRTKAASEALARDEAMLVHQAGDLRFDQFRRAVAYWSEQADPDGTEKKSERQWEARHLHLSHTFEGTWVGDLVLDPISGEIVSRALRRIEEELLADERAAVLARREAGLDDVPPGRRRLPSQRRADALVEMARRSDAAGPDDRRPEPLVSVLVGYETFAGRMCQLASGTVVTPGSLLRWLGNAWVERVVFDSPSRVIDVGVARRLFDGATRRAVQVRDQECFHPFCDRPAEQCQIDHVEPYAAGGRTVTANGRPACTFHNLERHRRRKRKRRPPTKE